MNMKSRIFTAVLLFLITLLSTGCGAEKAGPVSSPTSGDRQRFEDMGAIPDAPAGTASSTVSGPMSDKDTGVVTDVVVDVFRDADTQSERVTQALYNQPVGILEEKEAWMEVRVTDGYTGWIKSRYIDKNSASVKADEYKYKLVVTAKTKKISTQRNGGVTLKDVVMGTELFSRNKVDNWYEVAVPGNETGWVSESGLIQLKVDEHIPKTSAEDFVATAGKYSGASYLWGGVSAWGGIDCSGLTYICSRINGVDLPRDADQQFECGMQVEPEDIKPGDLVFFSTNEDKKDISHVGIYIGKNQFINASKARGSVVTNLLTEDYYKRRLVGAKRIF